MNNKRMTIEILVSALLVLAVSAFAIAQTQPTQPAQPAPQTQQKPAMPVHFDPEYLLGPEDRITVWVFGMEEITDKPMRVGPSGYLDFPVLGRVKAEGLTVEQLKAELVKRSAVEVREPRVAIELLEFGSQPVSVIGSVGQPGVHQLRGRRTLAEVLSLAGGPRPDAGARIKISRAKEAGPIPLPGVVVDETTGGTVAEVDLKDFLSAMKPAENIVIRPHDVITVPRADMVYVVGAVRKPGAIALTERKDISVLQALSLAEGVSTSVAAKDSKIVRTLPGGERKEIDIDLKLVMAGKAPNVALQPEDILFVPESTAKKAGTRVLDAAIQTLTGVVIWRGF